MADDQLAWRTNDRWLPEKIDRGGPTTNEAKLLYHLSYWIRQSQSDKTVFSLGRSPWVIAGAIEKPQSIEDFRQGRKEGRKAIGTRSERGMRIEVAPRMANRPTTLLTG